MLYDETSNDRKEKAEIARSIFHVAIANAGSAFSFCVILRITI